MTIFAQHGVTSIEVRKPKFLHSSGSYARVLVLAIKGQPSVEIQLFGKTLAEVSIDGTDNEPEPLPFINLDGCTVVF